jgi:protein gp37
MAERFPKTHGFHLDGEPKAFSRIKFHPERLDQPLRWKKPRRIFVGSMTDLFHEDVTDLMRDQVLGLSIGAPQHIYMLLTKRPERMHQYFNGTHPGPNIWLGVTAENQEMADQRIPILLQTPAAKRFVSVEPMLGPVDIEQYLHDSNCVASDVPFCICSEPREVCVDWVICGGESGPGARFMHPHWVENLRDQCTEAGVPFFFKGWGTKLMKKSDPNYMKINGREWKEFPAPTGTIPG